MIRQDAKILSETIENLNSLYQRLGGTLKPKFHNLTHYPRILLMNGPFIHFWCMRFESRHREIKSTAQSTASMLNLLVTVATKEMLRMCLMIDSVEYVEEIKYGSINNRDINESYFTDKEKNDNSI